MLQVSKGTVEECGAGTEPPVVHDSLDVSPVLWIGNEHERQEIPGLGGDIVGEWQWGIDDIFV